MDNLDNAINDICGRIAKVVADMGAIREHFKDKNSVWFSDGDDGLISILSADIERLMEALKLLSMLYENRYEKDIKFLIGSWFSALEDDGIDPWNVEECVEITNKYQYTREDYGKYLNTIT